MTMTVEQFEEWMKDHSYVVTVSKFYHQDYGKQLAGNIIYRAIMEVELEEDRAMLMLKYSDYLQEATLI